MVLSRDCIRSCIRGVAVLAVAASSLLAVSALTVNTAEASPPHSWSVVSSPNVSGPENSVLTGVSCASVTFCAARSAVTTTARFSRP